MKGRECPLIRLAPWEHLPEATPDQIEGPALNTAPFEWRGRRFEVAARFADVGDGAHYLFLRDITSNGEGNWVFGDGYYYDGAEVFYEHRRLQLPGRLAKVSKSQYFPFVRLFHFSPQELKTQKPWRASVTAHGIGCWFKTHSPDSGRLEGELFHLPVQPDESLLDWSAQGIKALLLQEIAAPDSDAIFALNWAHYSQVEQEDQSLSVRRGSVAQMRQVLTCAFALEPQLQKHPTRWNWEIEQQEQPWSGLNRAVPYAMPVWEPIPLRLQAWKQAVLAYFGPEFDMDLRRRHVCVRRSTGNHRFLMRIEMDTPSQHERMETALFLRDWARDKIAPRKLQLLLGNVGASH